MKPFPSFYKGATLKIGCFPGGGCQQLRFYNRHTGEGLSFFTFSRDAARKKTVFAKAGRKSVACMNEMWDSKINVLFPNWLRKTTNWPVCQCIIIWEISVLNFFMCKSFVLKYFCGLWQSTIIKCTNCLSRSMVVLLKLRMGQV